MSTIFLKETIEIPYRCQVFLAGFWFLGAGSFFWVLFEGVGIIFGFFVCFFRAFLTDFWGILVDFFGGFFGRISV